MPANKKIYRVLQAKRFMNALSLAETFDFGIIVRAIYKNIGTFP
jgi:hypothetical protein